MTRRRTRVVEDALTPEFTAPMSHTRAIKQIYVTVLTRHD